MLARFARTFTPRDSQYELLPTSERHSGYSKPRAPFPLPRWRVCRRCTATSLVTLFFAAAAFIGLLVWAHLSPWIWRTELLAPIFGPHPLPPLYPEFRKAELALPQHHVKDPFANGQKYLWIASHTWWSGWGNFMQDMVMNAHLTYRSGRTYVFDDYTWDKYGPPYQKFDEKRWIPSRIPITALISGPIAGGPFADGDATPRAVAKAHFKKICPNPTLVHGEELRALHGPGADAARIEETWLEYLAKIDDPCVEVPEDSGSIFHNFMFGTRDEMMPVWPLLSSSPILQLFGWSTLAYSAFETNRHLFAPAPLIPGYIADASCPHCVDELSPLDGLLALHLRRGDFLEHCKNLCYWGANFMAFTRFSEFPDPWEMPGGSAEERMPTYMRRCLPSVEEIVDKVTQVRASAAGRGLRSVYVMTNGDRAWLATLKSALRDAHGWEHVVTSRDLVLTNEEKYVSQAMDMMVGERAQVFVGNGFSSLTSNIAMLRMARKMDPETTHMW
ncbi:O-fucosyltransferase family protein [Phanerochaete sordida]|uniref:O-fucosyltransferase family protein n=1 Tax=Phanerochaete sordida TaxID=48140 RepID=A0A9P3G7T6_9APHY|nr:O-fucosyltransferase family protein [Phanerochaete sordida]